MLMLLYISCTMDFKRTIRDMSVIGTFTLHQLTSVRRDFAVHDGCNHDVRENIGDLGAISETTAFRDGQSESDLFEASWSADLVQLRNIPGNVMGHRGHVASDRTMQQEPVAGRHGITWKPLDAFQDGARCEYAVIVLNRPIYWKRDVLLPFWQKARITVTVDGGTQRWLNYLEEHGIDALNGKHKQYIPDLITGDMDSCTPFMVEKLGSIGSTIIETPDQNHTDFTKALLQVAHYAKTHKINLGEIYVLAETSGRFDHIIGNVNTLYKSDKLVGNIQVIQVASNSLTWILKPGLHSIHIPETLVRQKSWCGLLPFGCLVNCISTTGLKWNLNNTTMQFGGLISTSNTYEDCEVTVNTDTSVIWTMGIDSLKENDDEAS